MVMGGRGCKTHTVGHLLSLSIPLHYSGALRPAGGAAYTLTACSICEIGDTLKRSTGSYKSTFSITAQMAQMTLVTMATGRVYVLEGI